MPYELPKSQKKIARGIIEKGLQREYQNGAGFICVGMFDFQIVNDVNITIDTLNNLQGRKREWYA